MKGLDDWEEEFKDKRLLVGGYWLVIWLLIWTRTVSIVGQEYFG